MIIKEREYKTCPKCGSKELVKGAVFGCDNCEEPIDFNKSHEEQEYLNLTVFYHDEACDSKDLHLCSWECVFQRLTTLKTDNFVSLPYLSFDMKNKKIGVEGFRKALRNIRKESLVEKLKSCMAENSLTIKDVAIYIHKDPKTVWQFLRRKVKSNDKTTGSVKKLLMELGGDK